MAMAVSIVYMMSADGSIGQEEIGQLETMVGEFEGLQEFALKIVRKIKRSDFLNQAKHVLDKQQRLCVLLNVCDSMMSDESIGILEDKLFVSMLDAFSVKDSAFKKYYEVLELKNIKPFNVSSFEYSIEHIRTLSQQEQKGIVIDELDDQADVEISIQRTMDNNTEKVTNDFGSKDEIQKVKNNATHQLENQKVLDVKIDPNLQKVLSSADPNINFQFIGEGSISDKLKITSTDGRVENLQKVLNELSDKLNKFEAKNKSLLNVARVNANNESSTKSTFKKNENQVNKPKISSEAVKDNLQPIANKAVKANKLTVSKEAINDNYQAVASDAVANNKSGVAKERFEDNLQPATDKSNAVNNFANAKEAFKDNKQPIISSSELVKKVGEAKEITVDNLQLIEIEPFNNCRQITA